MAPPWPPHADRRGLFLEAGRKIVEIAKRHYEGEETGLLPREIATFEAFENAMSLDIAMGGSTNTVLHLLAIAHEGEVDFTMADMDRLSRKVPCLCKVAPNTANVHMEDIHRAGGIFSILGELSRAGLLHNEVSTVHSSTMGEAIAKWDIAVANNPEAERLFKAAPGGVRTTQAFSQSNRYKDLDTDRAGGVIRDKDHAFSADGGLAVLYGNIAEDGCIVKTAGVDSSILQFTGTAHVCESQDEAVSNILTGKVKEGDVVVIRYEGPRGGPGMQEMLYPTSYLKSKGLGQSLRAADRRAVFGRHVRPVHRPCLARGGGGGCDRPCAEWRPDRDRHSSPQHHPRRAGGGAWPPAAPRRMPGAGSPPRRASARSRPRSAPMRP